MKNKKRIQNKQPYNSNKSKALCKIRKNKITCSNRQKTINRLRGFFLFFAIKPTNISVLPATGVGARIYALLNVVKGMAEIEMLALNSKESFENNKAFYRQRANEEELPVIRKLLEQDSKHLDRIQVLMASSREFYILVRLQGKKESDVFSYLSRIEKSIKDNGFTVRRATEEDLKRMLGVYFEQNVTTERYEDHDGERWVLFGE